MQLLSYNLLSKYRTQLMGISIIMIMLYHTGKHLECSNILLHAISTWNLGVDFFAILSAIGIYYSLSKDCDIKNFYRKRVVRLIPTVLLVTIPFTIWHHSNNLWYDILRVTTITALYDDYSFWFICYILICYTISPWLVKIVNRTSRDLLSAIISCIFIYGLMYLLGHFVFPMTTWFLVRFAVYIEGLYLASFMKREMKVNRSLVLLLGIITSLLLVVGTYITRTDEIVFFVYLLSAPFILLSLAEMLQYTHTDINRMLTFMGEVTLECYILHENVIMIPCIWHIPNFYFAATLAFCISILIAYCLHVFVSKVINPLLMHK